MRAECQKGHQDHELLWKMGCHSDPHDRVRNEGHFPGAEPIKRISVLSHLGEVYSAATHTEFPPLPNLLKLRYTILPVTAVQGQKDFLSHSFCRDLKHMGIAFGHLPEGCRKPVLGVCIWATLRASLSGTFLQTLLDLVRPLKRHSLSPRSCPQTRSAPSERCGYR